MTCTAAARGDHRDLDVARASTPPCGGGGGMWSPIDTCTCFALASLAAAVAIAPS